jgi:hypothetical protein
MPEGDQRRKFATGFEGHFRSTAKDLSGQDPAAIGQGLVNPRALLRLARG